MTHSLQVTVNFKKKMYRKETQNREGTHKVDLSL